MIGASEQPRRVRFSSTRLVRGTKALVATASLAIASGTMAPAQQEAPHRIISRPNGPSLQEIASDRFSDVKSELPAWFTAGESNEGTGAGNVPFPWKAEHRWKDSQVREGFHRDTFLLTEERVYRRWSDGCFVSTKLSVTGMWHRYLHGTLQVVLGLKNPQRDDLRLLFLRDRFIEARGGDILEAAKPPPNGSWTDYATLVSPLFPNAGQVVDALAAVEAGKGTADQIQTIQKHGEAMNRFVREVDALRNDYIGMDGSGKVVVEVEGHSGNGVLQSATRRVWREQTSDARRVDCDGPSWDRMEDGDRITRELSTRSVTVGEIEPILETMSQELRFVWDGPLPAGNRADKDPCDCPGGLAGEVCRVECKMRNADQGDGAGASVEEAGAVLTVPVKVSVKEGAAEDSGRKLFHVQLHPDDPELKMADLPEAFRDGIKITETGMLTRLRMDPFPMWADPESAYAELSLKGIGDKMGWRLENPDIGVRLP